MVFKKERTTKTPYGFGTTLNVPYEEAIPRVKEALKAEGFGVLTEIDVRQTLREKLGAEIDPYLIETYADRVYRLAKGVEPNAPQSQKTE